MSKKLLSTRSHPADLDRQAKDLQAKAILATEEQIREQQQELGYDTTQLIMADISGINAGDEDGDDGEVRQQDITEEEVKELIIAELKVVAKDDTEVKLEQQEDICRYNEITIEVLEKYSELGEE